MGRGGPVTRLLGTHVTSSPVAPVTRLLAPGGPCGPVAPVAILCHLYIWTSHCIWIGSLILLGSLFGPFAIGTVLGPAAALLLRALPEPRNRVPEVCYEQ